MPRYTVRSEANRMGTELHTVWDNIAGAWAWSYYAAEGDGMGGTHDRPQFLTFLSQQAAQAEADRMNARWARSRPEHADPNSYNDDEDEESEPEAPPPGNEAGNDEPGWMPKTWADDPRHWAGPTTE
jgi:hypothetical protein